MNNTLIEWCDATWNPITGCPGPKVSSGCEHCYAERVMNTRLRHLYSEERPFEHIHFHPDRLDQPRKLKKPSRVFVGSMCDLFHDDVAIEALEPVFWEFSKCPQHTFLLLTKRPEKMRWWFSDGLDLGALLPNVWIGVTVCNQAEADAKIPVLLDTPAAKRFVSVEPMLGAVDLDAVSFKHSDGFFGSALRWHHLPHCRRAELQDGSVYPSLDWVICGGETGPGARPMHPDWVRGLRDQCAEAGTPFFFKGWGEWLPTNSCDWYRGVDNVGFVQKYGRTGREFPNSEGRSILGDGRVCLVDPPLKIANGFREKYKLPRNYKPDGRNLLIDAEALAYAHECGLHEVGYQWMYRVGKRSSGRLLDGREWNGVPS